MIRTIVVQGAIALLAFAPAGYLNRVTDGMENAVPQVYCISVTEQSPCIKVFAASNNEIRFLDGWVIINKKVERTPDGRLETSWFSLIGDREEHRQEASAGDRYLFEFFFGRSTARY